MYRISDIEGEFETRIIISNQEDYEDLYYIELYSYRYDFLETSFFEFEKAPSRDMVFQAIEDYLNFVSEDFMSYPLVDGNCLGMYDIKTNESVSYKKLDDLDYTYRFEHFIIDFESYEVVEED